MSEGSHRSIDDTRAKLMQRIKDEEVPGVVDVVRGSGNEMVILVDALTDTNDTPQKLGLPDPFNGHPLVVRGAKRPPQAPPPSAER